MSMSATAGLHHRYILCCEICSGRVSAEAHGAVGGTGSAAWGRFGCYSLALGFSPSMPSTTPALSHTMGQESHSRIVHLHF